MRNVLLIAAALCIPLTAYSKQPTAAAEGQIKTEDCGAHIRAKAPLPAKLADLLAQVAANMEEHVQWMKSSRDKASRAEVAVFARLAKKHAALSKAARKLSDEMARVELEPTPHDMSKAPASMTEGMKRQSTLTKEMWSLLKNESAEIDKNLAAMAGNRKGIAAAGK